MADATALPRWLVLEAKRMMDNSSARPRMRSWPVGTPFQQACWRAAVSIPPGQTRTYAWLAKKAGSSAAMRAAGQAMKRNPWPLVIPCHRVVGMNNVGGFSGSNNPASRLVKMKRWLLAREV